MKRTLLLVTTLSGSFACGDDIEPIIPDAAVEASVIDQLVSNGEFTEFYEYSGHYTGL